MLRPVLLSLGAALFFTSGAYAHDGHYERCAYGDTARGPFLHYHLGGYGPPAPCGGGGRYYDAPPPPPRDYYRPGYGYRDGRPGDYGPQTNRAQDCYNVYGRRICCPKGWTVQDGRCAPYRGR